MESNDVKVCETHFRPPKGAIQMTSGRTFSVLCPGTKPRESHWCCSDPITLWERRKHENLSCSNAVPFHVDSLNAAHKSGRITNPSALSSPDKVLSIWSAAQRLCKWSITWMILLVTMFLNVNSCFFFFVLLQMGGMRRIGCRFKWRWVWCCTR